MHEKHIVCVACDKKFPLEKKIVRCECGGTLEIVFDYRKFRKIRFESRPFNHARYKELFPVKSLVSLQEGGTPLLRSRNIEKNLPFELYFKNEAVNPTGSFKDRGSSVELAKALEFRAKKAVCASTGNMGSSLAAYSAFSGLPFSVIIPNDAQQIKVLQMLAHGSKVYRINDDYDKAATMAEDLFKKRGFFLFGDYLYRREGTKSLGFELAEQVSADYVFTPVGNGILIAGTWKGFKEFNILGKIKKMPKMVGVQASGSSTVAEALMKRTKIINLKHPHTIATAIEVGFPMDGKRAVGAMQESKGFAEEVTDSEILKARELLARKEGLFAEPAGAASLAGLLKTKNNIPKGSKVICLVTGHGLKSPVAGIRAKPTHLKALSIKKVR